MGPKNGFKQLIQKMDPKMGLKMDPHVLTFTRSTFNFPEVH